MNSEQLDKLPELQDKVKAARAALGAAQKETEKAEAAVIVAILEAVKAGARLGVAMDSEEGAVAANLDWPGCTAEECVEVPVSAAEDIRGYEMLRETDPTKGDGYFVYNYAWNGEASEEWINDMRCTADGLEDDSYFVADDEEEDESPVVAPMFAYSQGGALFTGRFKSRGEALEAARKEFPGQIVYTGRCVPYDEYSFLHCLDGDDIVCMLGECAVDNSGAESAEDWPSASDQDEERLGKEVQEVVARWLRETGNVPGFYAIEEIESFPPEGEP